MPSWPDGGLLNGRRLKVRCPDCGGVGEHTLGCVTAAVEDGKLTPRERQIMRFEAAERRRKAGIVETAIGGGDFTQAFRRAVDEQKLAHPRSRDGVLYANPADVQRLAEEFAGVPAGAPVNADAPLRFQGFEVKQNDAVPQGTLISMPRHVHDDLDAIFRGPASVSVDGREVGEVTEFKFSAGARSHEQQVAAYRALTAASLGATRAVGALSHHLTS